MVLTHWLESLFQRIRNGCRRWHSRPRRPMQRFAHGAQNGVPAECAECLQERILLSSGNSAPTNLALVGGTILAPTAVGPQMIVDNDSTQPQTLTNVAVAMNVTGD